MEINYFSVTGFINALTSFSLAALVLARGKRNVTNLTIALFCLSIAGWSGCYTWWHMSVDYHEALVANVLMMYPVLFLPVFYFHFVSALTGSIEKNRWVITVGYAVAGALMPFVHTRLFVNGLAPCFVRYWPKAGPLYIFHMGMFSFYIWKAVFQLIATCRTSLAFRQEQMKYGAFAMVCGFVGGAMNYLPCVGIMIPPYGNILVSFYVVVLAYSIMAQNLFEVNLAFRYVAIYSLFCAFVGVPIGMAVYLSGSLKLAAGMVALLSVVSPFLFSKMRDFLTARVDRLPGFRGRYERFNDLDIFSARIYGSRSLEEWAYHVVESVVALFQVKTASLLLLDPSLQSFHIRHGHGLSSADQVFLTLPLANPLTELMKSRKGLVMRDVLDEEMGEAVRRRIQSEMDLQKSAICSPMFKKGELTAVLCVGNKENTRVFNELDLAALWSLTRSGEEMLRALILGTEMRQQSELWIHDLMHPFGAKGSFQLLRDIAGGVFGAVSKEMELALSMVAQDMEFIKKHLGNVVNPLRELEETEMSVSPLVGVYSRIREKYAVTMFKSHIAWTVNVPPATMLAKHDPSMIEYRVITNLLENALRHTPRGGAIELGYRVEGGMFVGFVKDSGQGIDPTDIPKLFTPGVQLNPEERGKAGLGLYNVARVISRHRGKVWVESEKGRGATFFFTFPLAA